jgi:hypothetical protein
MLKLYREKESKIQVLKIAYMSTDLFKNQQSDRESTNLWIGWFQQMCWDLCRFRNIKFMVKTISCEFLDSQLCCKFYVRCKEKLHRKKVNDLGRNHKVVYFQQIFCLSNIDLIQNQRFSLKVNKYVDILFVSK